MSNQITIGIIRAMHVFVISYNTVFMQRIGVKISIFMPKKDLCSEVPCTLKIFYYKKIKLNFVFPFQ